jgi:L-lactate dehydrogenase complex protein LldF
LCGACYDVCPVKINIPEVLVHMRGRVVADKQQQNFGFDGEALAMQAVAFMFSDQQRYEFAQWAGGVGQIPFVHNGYIEQGPGPLADWTKMRDLVAIPKQSFRQWWRERNTHDNES